MFILCDLRPFSYSGWERGTYQAKLDTQCSSKEFKLGPVLTGFLKDMEVEMFWGDHIPLCAQSSQRNGPKKECEDVHRGAQKSLMTPGRGREFELECESSCPYFRFLVLLSPGPHNVPYLYNTGVADCCNRGL